MTNKLPDHPDIRRCLCSGYAHPQPSVPRCPECGEETDTYIKSRISGEILGCEHCTRGVDAWDEDDDHVSV